jgi:YHS domain-containing protein
MNLLSSPSKRRVLTLLSAAALALALAPGAVLAYDENSPAAINVDQAGVGLQGYDPVSYFSCSAPAKGKPSISARHAGATYHFASTANRDKFKAAPGKYAPQFGGFCAMGVALGKKLDVDPNAYRVVADKLYLNVNKDVQKRCLDDVPGNISTAEKSWPTLKDKVPKGL